MSNRRRLLNPQDPGHDRRSAITQWAASLDGTEISGGCDDCSAFQTVHVIDHGLITIRIHPDDWCPTSQRIESRRAALAADPGETRSTRPHGAAGAQTQSGTHSPTDPDHDQPRSPRP